MIETDTAVDIAATVHALDRDRDRAPIRHVRVLVECGVTTYGQTAAQVASANVIETETETVGAVMRATTKATQAALAQINDRQMIMKHTNRS